MFLRLGLDPKLLLECLFWTSLVGILVSIVIWFVFEILKTKIGKISESPPVCKNQTCDELNEKMTHLIKKQLSHQHDEKEEQEVIVHMRKMIQEVHCADCRSLNGSKCLSCQASTFSPELKQEFFQCLRTTLVLFPEDLRGRRRAREASFIAKRFIFKTKSEMVQNMSEYFRKIKSFCGKMRFNAFKITLIALLNMTIYWISRMRDVYYIHHLLFVKDIDNFTLETPGIKNCNITTQNELDNSLARIDGIYKSIGKSFLMMVIFIFFYNVLGTLENLKKKRANESIQKYLCQTLFMILFFPLAMFYRIWRDLLKLENPTEEVYKKFDDMTEDDFVEVTRMKNRRRERITEAFNGSKQMLILMMTNSLGFYCLMSTQNEEWRETNCLLQVVKTDLSSFLSLKFRIRRILSYYLPALSKINNVQKLDSDSTQSCVGRAVKPKLRRTLKNLNILQLTSLLHAINFTRPNIISIFHALANFSIVSAPSASS